LVPEHAPPRHIASPHVTLSQRVHTNPSLLPLHSPVRYSLVPVHSIWLHVLQMVFEPAEQDVLSYELMPHVRHGY
jgi:hypothetical protein